MKSEETAEVLLKTMIPKAYEGLHSFGQSPDAKRELRRALSDMTQPDESGFIMPVIGFWEQPYFVKPECLDISLPVKGTSLPEKFVGLNINTLSDLFLNAMTLHNLAAIRGAEFLEAINFSLPDFMSQMQFAGQLLEKYSGQLISRQQFFDLRTVRRKD